jgi:sterol desaturase/sphingolipid hydroxylase (fatty acid hydroxylase superfamily)
MLDRFYHTFFGRDVLVAPEYLLVWALLAWAVYLWRRETAGFVGWLLPRAIWRHRSTRADLELFAIGRLMALFGIVSRFVATPVVAAWVAGALPGAALGNVALHPVTLALLFFVITDFATYWSHRAHHTIATLWPLHAVHHSAAVLTPFTAYRQHPLGILVSASFQSVVVGALLGVLVGVLAPEASFAKIAGANAFVVMANLTVSNFHHAHIWISFGPVLERIVISPAQHQIHHSTNPAHFNRNYGNVLALWDWMFGTLYVTGGQEPVRFGLDGQADAPLMTHRLWPILWDPLRRMFGPTPPAR